MSKRKVNYDKYKLEWYVLNDCGDYRGGCEEKFKEYPYASGDIKPWNVFRNWPFKEAAVDLAIDYFKGKFTLETLKADNMEQKYDLKTRKFLDPVLNPKVAELKDDFEAFRYRLLQLLQWQEWSRCEYEILVCPLIVRDDKYEDKMQKIDCYEQVLPNADIFAAYVLMTVNGTLDTMANFDTASGDIMTINEFIKEVKDGSITDYDGTGYFLDEYNIEREPVVFDVKELKEYKKKYKKISWYNK